MKFRRYAKAEDVVAAAPFGAISRRAAFWADTADSEDSAPGGSSGLQRTRSRLVPRSFPVELDQTVCCAFPNGLGKIRSRKVSEEFAGAFPGLGQIARRYRPHFVVFLSVVNAFKQKLLCLRSEEVA